ELPRRLVLLRPEVPADSPEHRIPALRDERVAIAEERPEDVVQLVRIRELDAVPGKLLVLANRELAEVDLEAVRDVERDPSRREERRARQLADLLPDELPLAEPRRLLENARVATRGDRGGPRRRKVADEVQVIRGDDSLLVPADVAARHHGPDARAPGAKHRHRLAQHVDHAVAGPDVLDVPVR